jgi:hypothetical protein
MSFPKIDQYVPVSTTTSPVTQTADVAVNMASKKGVHSPELELKGIDNKNAPNKIMPPKLNTITWAGFKDFEDFKVN